MTLKRKFLAAVLLFTMGAVLATVAPRLLVASDHDDGETDTKGRNVNLTDLYVFRQGDQEPGAPTDQIIFTMNVNPRSVARQQYYFSTSAQYEFKVTRVNNINAQPTGVADLIMRLTFGAPDAQRRQHISLTTIRDGQSMTSNGGFTTPLSTAPIINTANAVGGGSIQIFAGLRQDVFFFDVEQFFRVRAGALGFGPPVVFRNPGVDFTWGYNTLSVALRVPRSWLRGGARGTTFDVWEVINYPTGSGGFTQVERLARPAINEGLLISNNLLNALNSVGPDTEAACLAGTAPPDVQAVCNAIFAEATATLAALGNSQAQIDAIVGAFLPDVMRIDTSGPSGYANAFNSSGSPVRGRKFLDDVIDITLSVLVPGSNPAVESDNVAYTSTQGTSTPHSPLTPSFPYLPAPH